MSLESLPVLTLAECDPSTKAFIKNNLEKFNRLFDKWNMQDSDFVLSNRTVHRFKNQQRHFIHFEEFCHLNRRLRKACTGRSNFCIKHVIRSLDSISEHNQCVSRNCIDFLLLAVKNWHDEVCVIRSLATNCWKHTERQMLTGHFVKLATLILCILSRVLIMSEVSISSAVELYNSVWAIRDEVPSVGISVDYLSCLPQSISFESIITLNKACTAFLKLTQEIEPTESILTSSKKTPQTTSKASNLFSEISPLPKASKMTPKNKSSTNDRHSNNPTPVGNNPKKVNPQKERQQLVSAYVAEKNIVEILSPSKRDGLPCILVDVSMLSEDFKRALSGEAGLDRLVQFIGRLSLSPGNKKTWCLLAMAYKFMDGVNLQSYKEVVRITRPYAKAINF
ncbi:unnamed protein product [Rodentolepis nana]|uniref:DUF4477 domain-containing protein n=1 Tax=Rodentolepis nana TaxID=102285 RepID=A0A0R3TMU7_RODNA|nr:unnamed protein product [Rodentolepis nana]